MSTGLRVSVAVDLYRVKSSSLRYGKMCLMLPRIEVQVPASTSGEVWLKTQQLHLLCGGPDDEKIVDYLYAFHFLGELLGFSLSLVAVYSSPQSDFAIFYRYV